MYSLNIIVCVIFTLPILYYTSTTLQTRFVKIEDVYSFVLYIFKLHCEFTKYL